MRWTVVFLVACLVPNPGLQAQWTGKLKERYDLLTKDERRQLGLILGVLREGKQYHLFENPLSDAPNGFGLPVYFMRQHRAFFESPAVKPLVLKWADHEGAKKFLELLNLSKHPRAQEIKFEFALLSPLRDSRLELREEPHRAAIRIAGKIKRGGVASLDDEEKVYVRQNKNVFFPGAK